MIYYQSQTNIIGTKNEISNRKHAILQLLGTNWVVISQLKSK